MVGDNSDKTLNIAKYTTNGRLVSAVLFSFLSVVVWESVAVGDSLVAPRGAAARISHPNQFPDDAFTAVQRFELRQINGKWKTIDAKGNAFTARGNYNYVAIGDSVYVTKVPSQPAMGQRDRARR